MFPEFCKHEDAEVTHTETEENGELYVDFELTCHDCNTTLKEWQEMYEEVDVFEDEEGGSE